MKVRPRTQDGSLDILLVGDVMVDIVVAHTEPVATGSDTPARILMRGGGSAANTACWLASMGRAVGLGGSVGSDPLGVQVVQELERSGVDTRFVVAGPLATGSCVVLVDASGERTMFPDRGANAALDIGVMDDAVGAAPPRWFHLSGYSLLGIGSRTTALDGLDRMRARSVPTSVDASSAAPIAEVGAASFLNWIDGIDLLFANEDEVAALGGGDIVIERVGALVTKLGPNGARWTDGSKTVEVQAVAAAVIDTTGAGDAFAAGYLGALLDLADPHACLAAGCRMAAVAVGIAGGRPPEGGAGSADDEPLAFD